VTGRYPAGVLAAPQHGFVLLAMPKTASTSIEEALRRDALIATGTDPRVKHLHYRGFERFLEPWLKRVGYPRESYEVICMVREPISWLHSWYRYRSRADLANPSHRRHAHYTGGSSFDEFALAYMRNDGFARVGRQAKFVRAAGSPIGPDRMFRFEELDGALGHIESRIGHPLRLKQRNVSPTLPLEMSPEVEERLRAFLEPEFELWRLATGEALNEQTPRVNA
jgi:hypothetical protein